MSYKIISEAEAQNKKPAPESIKTRVRDLFESAVEVNNEDSEDRKKVNEKIDTLTDIIISCQVIRPDGKAKENEFVFETDLHGDMRAFLDTLLKNGMVEYDSSNLTGIVFCDPNGDLEYTLEELEDKKKTLSIEAFTELMDRIQMLPAVVPTEKFKNYINCGDFLDRGEQSEQMIPLVTRLCKKFGEEFKNSEKGPTILMGNHEVFYVDRNENGAFENSGNFLLIATPTIYDTKTIEKFKTITSLTRKAVYDGTLKLASSKGNTLFSHTVVTKAMVKSLAENLSELSKDPNLAEVLDPKEVERAKETAETFEKLNNLIKEGKEFKEEDIKDLASALNNFNILRTRLVERREKFYDEPERSLPYLDGEKRLINIMSRGGKGSLTWQRKNQTLESDLIKGIKYVVGHDAVSSKDIFNSQVLYADTGRSSGYNNGTTKASYFHCDESAFEGYFFKKEHIYQEKEIIGPKKLGGRVKEFGLFRGLKEKIVSLFRKMATLTSKVEFLERNKNNSKKLFQNKNVKKNRAQQINRRMNLRKSKKQVINFYQVKNNLKLSKLKNITKDLEREIKVGTNLSRRSGKFPRR
ncbi:MAG: metallophosphoesterase [Rickettsiales bacterium]|jgi:hypothetical protein|nr:metallophosphoesterase [Rickettsiales bacterium]